ncbi:hypothetical protein ACFGVR_08515 [Mucilaginibacter sp. AW1-3]
MKAFLLLMIITRGENPNSFYQLVTVPAPVISPQAGLAQPMIKNTFLYDVATVRGGTYTFINK